MKKTITKAIISTLLCATACLTTSCIFYPDMGKNKKKPKPNPGNSIPQKEGMRLVWSDEFNYNGALDTTKWKYEYGAGGWGNGELQNYVGDGTTAFVSNGALTLKAYYAGSQWRSARINSKQSWTYGFIEASIKVTDKKGAWPAFWMMPKNSSYGIWPKSGEIDIMETLPPTMLSDRTAYSARSMHRDTTEAEVKKSAKRHTRRISSIIGIRLQSNGTPTKSSHITTGKLWIRISKTERIGWTGRTIKIFILY